MYGKKNEGRRKARLGEGGKKGQGGGDCLPVSGEQQRRAKHVGKEPTGGGREAAPRGRRESGGGGGWKRKARAALVIG